MSRVQESQLLPAPLDSPAELVDLLAECTGEPRNVVLSRLADEIRCSGVNVRRDAEQFGLEPYVWSENLLRFYRETTSFVYETAVWNHSRLKQSIRKWIGGFLPGAIPPGAAVLVYGDGLGFDSAFLASLGFQVTSLEPSEGGRRFAARVFEKNKVAVRQVATDDDLAATPFEAILCLDVLEHVPSPAETLAGFARRLVPGGILVASAPFFCIEPYRPTHLRSNRNYSGSLSLFRSAGFEPVAGRYVWDPIAFRKGPAGSLRQTALLRLGQPLLLSGRWLWPIHSQVARWMLKADPAWLRQIEQLGRAG
jgi:SAM-dependent methyltransferase